MFSNLVQALTAANRPATDVFLIHPLQLSRWLDEAWASAPSVPPIPGGSGRPFLGDAQILDALDLPHEPGRPTLALIAPSGIDVTAVDDWTRARIGPAGSVPVQNIWHHLIYAYLVESTGIFEVFTEVVRRLVVGESLGALSAASTKWLRATEELFFRDPPLFSIYGVVSEVRPYSRINRRVAYSKVFDLDLPHRVPEHVGGGSLGDGWKAGIGGATNVDFRAKWTELLRQVWMGLENRSNQNGPNPTDPAYVALLCTALRDMMQNRRRGGQLAREEFAYVSALNWFHETIRLPSSIVADLKVESSSEDGRLAQIASRVGMKSADRSRELLLLAEKVSTVLRAIEIGLFDTPAQAAALFTGTNQLTEDMNDIVNLWQSATGDRVKDRIVSTVSASPQPIRIPTPATNGSSNGSTNGARV